MFSCRCWCSNPSPTLWSARPAPGQWGPMFDLTEYQVSGRSGSPWLPNIWPIFADTITEIVCQKPTEDCAGYKSKCRQMKTVMQVVYLEGVTTTHLAPTLSPVSLTPALIRNLTVLVGCSCVSRWGLSPPLTSPHLTLPLWPLQTAGVLQPLPARPQGQEETARTSHSPLVNYNT